MTNYSDYQVTYKPTGEIIDLSRLAQPPRRTKYNQPVRRTRSYKKTTRRMRRADRQTLFLLGVLLVVAPLACFAF